MIGMYILAFIISFFTFGIATAWAVVMVKRWKVKHTYIEGQQLQFVGSGIGLFLRYLLWGFIGGLLVTGMMIAFMFMVLGGIGDMDLANMDWENTLETSIAMFAAWTGIFFVVMMLFGALVNFFMTRWFVKGLRFNRGVIQTQ